MLYLAAFGFGTVLGMILITLTVASTFAYGQKHFAIVGRHRGVVAGLLAAQWVCSSHIRQASSKGYSWRMHWPHPTLRGAVSPERNTLQVIENKYHVELAEREGLNRADSRKSMPNGHLCEMSSVYTGPSEFLQFPSFPAVSLN